MHENFVISFNQLLCRSKWINKNVYRPLLCILYGLFRQRQKKSGGKEASNVWTVLLLAISLPSSQRSILFFSMLLSLATVHNIKIKYKFFRIVRRRTLEYTKSEEGREKDVFGRDESEKKKRKSTLKTIKELRFYVRCKQNSISSNSKT